MPFIINADSEQGLPIDDLRTLFLLLKERLNAEVGLQKSDPKTFLAYFLGNLFLIGRRVVVDDIPFKTCVAGSSIKVIGFSGFNLLWLLL